MQTNIKQINLKRKKSIHIILETQLKKIAKIRMNQQKQSVCCLIRKLFKNTIS